MVMDKLKIGYDLANLPNKEEAYEKIEAYIPGDIKVRLHCCAVMSNQ